MIDTNKFLQEDTDLISMIEQLGPEHNMLDQFRNLIYSHYDICGRDLPWRNNPTHYEVFVSEIMLQQTQAERVAIKFPSFISRFPGFSELANSDLEAVLKEWQGLGYNRRALALHRAARIIVSGYAEMLPAKPDALVQLPGIGPATAASICAFAFNMPAVFLETNIRSVFIHFFFNKRQSVEDSEILPLAEKALDRTNPSRWYNAIMDYGAMLKKTGINPTRKSPSYKKQAPFMGSNRRIRGIILKKLLENGKVREDDLAQGMPTEAEKIHRCLNELVSEGFTVQEQNGDYHVREQPVENQS